MLRFFRVALWRIRDAWWLLSWRIMLALATWRTVHGIRVGLRPSFDYELGDRAMDQVGAAIGLIADYDPRRMKRIAGDIAFFWVKRAGYASAYFIQETRVCVLDSQFLTRRETAPPWVAVAIVHEATHARLEKSGIRYSEPARPRIEALCDAQSAEFVRRLPDGEALARRILEGRPVDQAHWSNENLDRRLAVARKVELDTARQDLEHADLPSWLKRVLQRLIRSRAA